MQCTTNKNFKRDLDASSSGRNQGENNADSRDTEYGGRLEEALKHPVDIKGTMDYFNKEFPADENPDFKDQESDSDTTCEPSSCDVQTSSDEDIDCSQSDKRERRVVKWQGCITSCERNENGHKPNNEGFHSTGKTAEFAQDNVDVILRDTIIIQRSSGAYLLVPKPKDGVKLKIISIKVGKKKTDYIMFDP